MRVLSAFLAAVAAQQAFAASAAVNYNFDGMADLGNPLIGFAHYYPFGVTDPVVPCSLENFYLSMRDVMQGWNDFTFDQLLEPQLNEIAARNRTAIFRIYLVYPGKTPKPNSAVPDFLVNGGLKFNSFPGGVSPDWEDSNLIKAMLQLIEAMGKRYDADPRVANINLGLLGHWGEWHGNGQVPFASVETQNQVLNAYQSSFKVTQLSARYPDVFGSLKAGDTRFGYHDDSFVQDTTLAVDWGFMNRMKRAGATEQWKNGAIGGEFRPELQACYFDNDDWTKVCGGAPPPPPPPSPTPPPTPHVAIFKVSGASGTESTDLNGEFFQEGTHNNRVEYMKQGGWAESDAVFRWEVKGDWAADNLGTPGKSKWTAAVNSNHRYFSETDSPTPPKDGWIARTDFATGSISLDYESTELQAQSGDCGNCPDGPIEDDIAITHSSWQWNNGLSGYGPKGSAKANRARKAVSGMGYKFFLQQVSLTPQGSSVKIEAKVVNRGVAPFYYPVSLQVEVGGVKTTLGSLDMLMPDETADLTAEVEATSDTAFLSLQSPWAPTGVRFAIAEQQTEQDGIVGVALKLHSASTQLTV